MGYRQWLSQVCRYVEELLDCTATIKWEWEGDVILTFKPFGTVAWFMTFEDSWLRNIYNFDPTSPKATAYNMTIMTEQEWRQIIRRKGESND